MQPKTLISTSQESNIKGKMIRHTSTINAPAENWSLKVETMTPDLHEAREVCQISISLPNGRKFSCTIQELQNMEPILRNAREELAQYASNGFTDKEDEKEVLDSMVEVDTVMRLFSSNKM